MPKRTPKASSSESAAKDLAEPKAAELEVASPARKARYLVVVESPAKAKTIRKYLGTAYVVKASVGHVKDLPKSKMGVDVKHGFKPQYQVIKGKEKVLAELKKEAKAAHRVYLATD